MFAGLSNFPFMFSGDTQRVKGLPQQGRERLASCRYHGERDESPSCTDGPRALVLAKRQRELTEVGTKYAMKMLIFRRRKNKI